MTSAKLSFFLRLGSTIGLWALILAAVLAGNPAGFFAVIAFMALVALWEYFHMVRADGTPVFTLTGMVCAVVLLAGGFWILAVNESSADFEIAVLVAFLIVIFARQMFRPIGESLALRAVAYTVFGLFYIPWLFSFISKLIFLFPRAADGATTGQYYVLFLVMVTKFSDMGAYVFGSLFGRHPFAPHISPKKTWEGFFGAIASALLAAMWLYGLIPDRLAALRFDDVLVLGVLLGVAAVVGDLAESVVKRSTHAKDSSHLLPGIGGTLDLIDSLLFTAPLMYFYLRFVIGVG